MATIKGKIQIYLFAAIQGSSVIELGIKKSPSEFYFVFSFSVDEIIWEKTTFIDIF